MLLRPAWGRANLSSTSAAVHPPSPESTPPESLLLDVPALRQPDDFSCGPTCLFKVLRTYGDGHTFDEVSGAVERGENGGTLGVFLGQAALDLGYDASLYSYNLRVCDPTWAGLSAPALANKLAVRAATIEEPKLRGSVEAYARFVRAGGAVRLDDLSVELLVSLLDRGHPILCGLSATYLYQTPRTNPRTNGIDDVGGEPEGHFIVVSGYRQYGRHFIVSDPYRGLPMTVTGTYEVSAQRLLNAILLGDVTYDGVLLVVAPKQVAPKQVAPKPVAPESAPSREQR